MPLSSFNTGLQQVPDLLNITSVGKLSFQFISIYNAIGVLQQAIDSYTGNSPAPSNNSNQNAAPETTVLIGNTANMWLLAAQNINAGFLVTITNSGGTAIANLSNVASTPYGQAMGISMTNATTGNPLQILLLGLFNFGGSVTPGGIYYASALVPGGLSLTPPSVSGQLIQPVGFGVDSNSIFFNPCMNPQV